MMRENLAVLMISNDRNIALSESSVLERMKEYAGLVGELHIVLFSNKTHGLKNQKVGDNLWIYPTNSFNKFFRFLDAFWVGRKIDTDIITTQDPFECGFAGLLLKRVKRVPLEVQLHTDMFSPYFNGFINQTRKFIAKIVLPRSDGVRVVTESLKNKILEKNLNKNVCVSPIYIDKNRIEGEAKFDLHEKYGWKKILLTVSRLSPEKNIEMMLQALSIIVQKNPDTGLVVVGSGSEEGKLKTLVQRLNLDKNVVFEGWQKDLASYYKSADIYVQTSNFEGYGLSLVEAGLTGLPIVTTPVGIANDLKKVTIITSVDELAETLTDGNLKRGLIKEELIEKIYSKELFLKKLKENWISLIKN